MDQTKKSYSYIHTVPEKNSNYALQTNWQIDNSSTDWWMWLFVCSFA